MYHIKFDVSYFFQSVCKIPAESKSSRMADMSVEEMTIKANHITDEVSLLSDSIRIYKKVMIWLLLVFISCCFQVPVQFPAYMKAMFFHFCKLKIKTFLFGPSCYFVSQLWFSEKCGNSFVQPQFMVVVLIFIPSEIFNTYFFPICVQAERKLICVMRYNIHNQSKVFEQ